MKIVDRLDPGIAKRPSRFDRKYLFPLPARNERVNYCLFWRFVPCPSILRILPLTNRKNREKVTKNPEIKFPEELCNTVADLTEGFSFAYMKEAFLASLLVVANGDVKEGLEAALREQIKNLREEFEGGGGDDDE
jgi:transitional endoplasmic reticulum ATPase